MPPISTINSIAKIFNGDKQIVKIFAGANLIYEFSEGGGSMPPATGLIYITASDDDDGLYALDKTLTLQGAKIIGGTNYRPYLVGIYPNGDYVAVWNNIGASDAWIIRKYSSSNSILWNSANADGWDFGVTRAARALVNSNGDILIQSNSTVAAYRKTLKIDGTDGSIIWSKTTAQYLYGDTFRIDKEDNFYTLSSSLLSKWDTNGDNIWSVTLNTSYGNGALFIDKDYNVYACYTAAVYYKCDKNGQNGSYITIQNATAAVYGFLIDEVNGYIYTSTSFSLIQRDLNGDIIWTTSLTSSGTGSGYRAGIHITEDYKIIVGLNNGLDIFTTAGVKTGLTVDDITSIAYYNPDVQPWADNS